MAIDAVDDTGEGVNGGFSGGSTGFERGYIRVNYIDVELNVDRDAGFTFDLRTRYGGIDFDTGRATNKNTSKSGSSRTATGSFPGKGQGKIDISTSYGDISIY